MPETELVVVLRGLQGRYSAAYVGLHDLHAGLGWVGVSHSKYSTGEVVATIQLWPVNDVPWC